MGLDPSSLMRIRAKKGFQEIFFSQTNLHVVTPHAHTQVSNHVINWQGFVISHGVSLSPIAHLDLPPFLKSITKVRGERRNILPDHVTTP